MLLLLISFFLSLPLSFPFFIDAFELGWEINITLGWDDKVKQSRTGRKEEKRVSETEAVVEIDRSEKGRD